MVKPGAGLSRGVGAQSGTDRHFPKSEAVHSLPAQLLQALEWFPPGPRSRGFSFPPGSCVPQTLGHAPPGSPGAILCRRFSLPFCKHVKNCLSEIQFSTPPAIFWPPLSSALRIEILSPGLHEELVKQKKQEINVPASRLHTALDGIKGE